MGQKPCMNKSCRSYGQVHPNCQCWGEYARGGKVSSRFCDSTRDHKPGCAYMAKGGFVLDKEDDNHYTLKHPKGDEIKIAKKGLSKQMHDHVRRLAKGGEVKPVQDLNQISQGFNNSTGNAGIKQAYGNMKPANYAEGTCANGVQVADLGPMSTNAPPQEAADGPAYTVRPEFKQKALQVGMNVLNAMGVAAAPGAAMAQKVGQGIAKQVFEPNPNLPQNAQMVQANEYAPGHSNVPLQAPQPAQQMQQQQAPQNELPTIDPEIKQLQDIANQQKARGEEMHTRAMNVLKDLNEGQIDFNRAFNDKSVPQKILAGIGIALSGIGSGLTKQPNMAMEMINKEIERDIEQQKAQIGKKATVLSGYLNAYKDETAATNAYREDLQALVAGKMQQYGLKMQGKMMGAMGGGEGMGQYLSYLRMTNPEMAKSLESRMVPSLGGAVADVPLTSEDRESLAKGMELDKKLGEVHQFAKIHAGSVNPAIIAQGQALASQANALYREASHQGVWKKAGQEYDETMIPADPTKFFGDLRTVPKYKAMMDFNRSLVHATAGKYFNKNPLDQWAGMSQIASHPGIPNAQQLNIQRVSNKR